MIIYMPVRYGISRRTQDNKNAPKTIMARGRQRVRKLLIVSEERGVIQFKANYGHNFLKINILWLFLFFFSNNQCKTEKQKQHKLLLLTFLKKQTQLRQLTV